MYERLGGYSVEKKLADGGMGSVYLGRSPAGVSVVLKVPHAQDRDSALALIDEANAGMRLKHPAIVETLDCFVDRGVSVLVVAFIEGSTLFELRKRAGALSAPAVAEMGAQLASALDAIHSAVDEKGRPLSMLHRDVSPNNVLVDAVGQARLIDLGIVRSSERKQKATMQGMVKGTLRYLAPEILEGGEHSAASDLWALGLTLYEAALGHYAAPGDEMATVRAVMDGSLFASLLRASGLEPSLVEVLAVLIAPQATRMRNAKAAATVLTRLAAKLETGREDLAKAARAPLRPATGRSPAPVPLEVTEVTARNAIGPETTAPTQLSSRGDVESVFTSNVARAALPTLQMPSVAPSSVPSVPPSVTSAPSVGRSATPSRPPSIPIDVAPTILMPAFEMPDATSPKQPALAIDTAPTIQMGAWQPPQADTGSVVKVKPAAAMVDTTAPTSLAMPKVEPSAPPVAPPVATAAPVAKVDSVPSVPKPQVRAPAPSLFLPIVVIDEDGSEIE